MTNIFLNTMLSFLPDIDASRHPAILATPPVCNLAFSSLIVVASV
jgi:hypothetical protein